MFNVGVSDVKSILCSIILSDVALLISALKVLQFLTVAFKAASDDSFIILLFVSNSILLIH